MGIVKVPSIIDKKRELWKKTPINRNDVCIALAVLIQSPSPPPIFASITDYAHEPRLTRGNVLTQEKWSRCSLT